MSFSVCLFGCLKHSNDVMSKVKYVAEIATEVSMLKSLPWSALSHNATSFK